MKYRIINFFTKNIKFINKYLLIIGIFVILAMVGSTSYALFSYDAYSQNAIHIVFNDIKGPSCSIEITENENADSRTLTLKSSELDVSSSGYSFDGTNFSSTNTKQVTTSGTYTAYVKDTSGNVGSCNTTVSFSSPTAYNIIGTYTSSQTWTAPESGYFQVEVFGASGSGGAGSGGFINASGGGGGGGYSSSKGITLNKGDTIVLTIGGVGSTTTAVVNSSHNNSYDHTLQVTSGANGGSATTFTSPGSGGSGGVASGGKTTNANGGAGGNGVTSSIGKTATPGTGGTAGYSGGNVGGAGGPGSTTNGNNTPGSSGSAGFIKIYCGNTN